MRDSNSNIRQHSDPREAHGTVERFHQSKFPKLASVLEYHEHPTPHCNATNVTDVLRGSTPPTKGLSAEQHARSATPVVDFLSTETRSWSQTIIRGYGATFSPDGTCVASIYGKFLKIWKTHSGHEVQGASVDLLNEEIDDIFSAPDERLVAFKFKNSGRWQVLGVTTSRSLFTFVNGITSVAFSLTFVGWLRVCSNPDWMRDVDLWNIHISRPPRTIKVDSDAFHITPSPDDSRLVSLSERLVQLWDLETKDRIAHLALDHYIRRHGFHFRAMGPAFL